MTKAELATKIAELKKLGDAKSAKINELIDIASDTTAALRAASAEMKKIRVELQAATMTLAAMPDDVVEPATAE